MLSIKNYLYAAIFLAVTGCTYTKLDEVMVNCDDIPISIDTSSENSDCGVDNGSVLIMASGGVPPYTYQIDNTVQNEPGFSGLAAGTYQVLVIDSQGCLMTTDFTVFNNEGVLASATIVNSGCGTSQGSITVQASNGLTPYSYSLNNSAPQSENVFSNLATGSYNIKVTDELGCEFTFAQQILTGESYAQDIQPIIMNSCAVIGCHSGTQFPDLRVLANVQANKIRIRDFTQSGFMPFTGSLTQEQIDAIACWIDDGALDN